ncbi:phosphoglycerate kinase [Hirschia baltica]|uniref:Phosphoglycerate kinase n=1 Tax=Hirschia baltica (strain ATCC 49814 / DSM 5838 / IFAM 1418) TaxID=582402 RepID=C6XRN7_HIRBI|nr:phosphoglycerate kinase [Hirschia baltica]ACT60647.1 Phosphoglycerate kinase [Hirschia baltica ATCC 49814]
MSNFRTIDTIANELDGKTALVRVDFNVPMNDAGEVTDDTRLRAAMPTIKFLIDKGAKVALLAHFGRPKGKVVPEMSLGPVVPAIEAVLGKSITFATACVGPVAQQAIDLAGKGDVILLENTRFEAGEEKNDTSLAEEMSKLGDIFVNDAFSAAHRAHVTTEGITKFLPAYAGRSMEAELKSLDAALGTPVRPVVAVVGGAKVSSKIDLLKNLVSKVDTLAIGGGMANTFLFADGINVGKSLCESELTGTVAEIKAAAEKSGCKILLPTDVVCAKEFKAFAPSRICDANDVADDEMILDAGPIAAAALVDEMSKSKTVVWNGPLGAFELEPFDEATVAAAKGAGDLAKSGKITAVAGGGDTVAALNHAGAAEDFTFISTAGGAFLEWMEGKILPGVEALRA